jgi:predicted alpha-1,2-mannosidase
MIFKTRFLSAAAFLLTINLGHAGDLASLVNPFIGASTSVRQAGVHHGLGKTFPGATLPFGMVQVSPNTITGGDNGNGYSYEHEFIEGFAFTQMSGVGWYGDLGNFLVTPTVGELEVVAGRHPEVAKGYRVKYRKESEVAEVGYYAVTLANGVRTEATASYHSGILRFTFPKNEQSRVQIDLARRVGGTSVEQEVSVVGKNAIEGWMKCTPDGGGWGNGDGNANYTVYFHAEFSRPLEDFGAWSAEIPDGQSRKREAIESSEYDAIVAKAQILKGARNAKGKHLGFYANFPTTEDEQIELRVGISFTSVEAARANFDAEVAKSGFDEVRAKAHEIWDKELSKVTVKGGTEEQRRVFYTALYHTMIDPRRISDIGGTYPGPDGKVHEKSTFEKRTIFSGWDVFRSEFPLLTIIEPRVVSDTINSLIDLADGSGRHYFERWEFFNSYTGCMIGNPAVVVIADAYAKGIRDFDLAKAREYARNSCEKFGTADPSTYENVSKTLEYAYSEWCLAQLDKAAEDPGSAAIYEERAGNYKKAFDPDKGWFRPKQADGSWAPWPEAGRLQDDYGCVESNLYQQGWFVPHDIPGLAELLGGREKALAELTAFFDKTPETFHWNSYYNHANEPVHHAAFLFNRLGAPWLTQKWTRTIVENAYHDSVDGLVGNEDVGQMSAWYVLASSGIHPVCPGDGLYEITSPLFSRISFKLDSRYAGGAEFTIVAKNNSAENRYIQSATLNGVAYNRTSVSHAEIARGGVLELTMGAKPNPEFGKHSSALTGTP